MKLTAVNSSNFKGWSFFDELAPVTIFTGDNDKGKSSRLEAITLAICGYLPAVKRTLPEIFKLSSGESMSVAIRAGDGTEIERAYARDAKGSVSCNVRSNGELSAIPPVLLDPGSFFESSERERMQMIFRLLPVAKETVTPESIKREIMLACGSGVSLPKSITGAVRTILDELLAAHEEEGATINDLVGQLVATLRDKRLEAEAVKRRLKGTVEGLGQMAVAQKPGSLVDKSDEINALRTQTRELWETLNTLVDRDQKMRAVTLEMDALTAKIGRDNIADEIKDTRAKLDAAEKAFEDKYRMELEHVNKRRSLEGEAESVRQSIKDLEQFYQRQCKGREANLASKCCPTCKAKGTGWKKRLKADYAAQDKHYQKAWDKLAARLKEIDGQLHKYLGMPAPATDSSSTALRSKAEKFGHVYCELVREQAEQEQAKKRLAELGSAVDKEFEQLESAEHVGIRIAEARAALAAAEARQVAVENEQREVLKAKAEQAVRVKARQEWERVLTEVDVFKGCEAVAEAIQRELVEASLDKVKEVANLLAKPVLRGTLVIRNWEFCLVQDDGNALVTHEAMGGRTRAICHVAISLALGALSPCKIMLLDEMGRLDPSSKTALLNTVLNLVKEGVLEQFIGADVNVTSYAGLRDIPLVKVINL